ncbi:MAG: MFS transporter [Cyanobacteriota bacterium]
MANEQNGGFKLPGLSVGQLINLCVGIIGIQFAWSMQIALSSRVLEPLGADPFIFGLIWCAGPVTGLMVQPIVGALSDRTWTKIGRRRPFLLVGAFLGGVALLFFPFAPTLLIAALMIWIIDACVNISQGPYRALVPDITPPEQHAVANSYLNFAFGAGSVIALGVAPLLNAFNIEMTVTQQYIMAALALILFICYTSLTIKEYAKSAEFQEKKKKESILDSYKKFLKCSKEIHKICGVQFLTWMGIMCMFIYLTQYTVHYVYKLPDMSTPAYKTIKEDYNSLEKLLDNIKVNSKTITSANLKLNEILANIDNTEVDTAAIDQITQKSISSLNELDQISLTETVKHDLERYKLLNDSIDEILLGIASDKKEFEKTYSRDLKAIIKNSETVQEKIKNANKLCKIVRTNYKELLKYKELLEYKMMLIQYNVLTNPKAFKNVEYLEKNKTLTKEIDKLETVNASILKVYNKNKLSNSKKDIESKEKYNIDTIKTLPGTIVKFYQQNNMSKMHITELDATNTTQWALVAFNLIPLFLSIPLGYMCNKLGKKPIYSVSLGFIAIAFAFAPFIHTSSGVIIMMACAGVAWATILSIPFAFLCDYMPEGEEGSIMGIFNMFIAGPQLISATIVGWVIRSSPIVNDLGQTHNWSIAFLVASVSVFFAIVALQFVNETKKGLTTTSAAGGH